MKINRLAFYAIFVFVGLQTFIARNMGLSYVSYADEVLVLICILLLVTQSTKRLAFDPRFLWLIVAFVVLACMSAIGLTKTIAQVVIGYWDIYKNFFMILGLPLLLRALGISSQLVEKTLIKFLYASLIFTIFFYLFPTSFLNANQEHLRMGIYRLSGLVSDINSYAFVLMLFLFAVQTNFVNVSNKRIVIALLLVLIFLTFSRTTLLYTILGMILLNANSIRKMVKYGAVVAVLLVAMSIYDSRTISAAEVASHEFTFNPLRTTEVSDDFGETQYRMVVYLKSFQMFAAAPFIGYGLGTFGTPISLMERSPLYEDYGFPQVEFVEGGFNVQDVYYPILYVQSGLVGLGIFAFISYVILVRYRNREEKRFFSLVYFCILGLALNSMTFMVGSLMFFYSLFFAIAELRHLEQKDQASHTFKTRK